MGIAATCPDCEEGELRAVGLDLDQEKLACTHCGLVFVIDLKEDKEYED